MSIKLYTLSWNGKEKLDRLYQSLLPALEGLDWSWWIKDNGSIDETLSLKNKWNNDRVNIIDYKHNKDNFSQGCNFLHKESSCKDDDIVFLVNNDIIINDKKSIKNMVKILTTDEEVGVVGCKLKFDNTKIIQHAGVVFASNGFPIHFRANQNDDKNASMNREFQACTGAFMALRGAYCNLDDNLKWAFDDIDLCLDIKYNKNKKIIYCGETDIFHEESATFKHNPINKLFLNHNLSYFSNKWRNNIKIDYDIYHQKADVNLYHAKQ